MIFLKLVMYLNYLVITVAVVMNIKYAVLFYQMGNRRRANATVFMAILWLLWGIVYASLVAQVSR